MNSHFRPSDYRSKNRMILTKNKNKLTLDWKVLTKLESAFVKSEN